MVRVLGTACEQAVAQFREVLSFKQVHPAHSAPRCPAKYPEIQFPFGYGDEWMDAVRAVVATIRWDTIRSVTGDCTNIPNALSLLQSDEPVTRKSAYWMLDNHIVVQGGLFEGAFYVVPFLLHVCNSASPNGRSEAMTLLFEIAAGASNFESQVRYATIGNPYMHYVPDPHAIGIPLAIAVRLAVACGIPAVATYMASENDVERRKARELLSLFPEYASGLSELLRPIAEKTSNQQARKDIYGLINALRR